MWKMDRDDSEMVENVFGNGFGLGNKLKSLFGFPKVDCLTQDPGNTETPVILINQ